MNGLKRAVNRDVIECLADGATELIIGRKACDLERRGVLERASIGNLVYKSREVTSGSRVANHIIDLTGLEGLEALINVGEGLLIGSDALLGQRLLRSR